MRPGNLGAAVHNTGYAVLGLNFIYLPRTATDAGEAMAAVRTLGIRGCSVSMPFKRVVMAYLDDVDPVAQAIGAVNTVVNDNGRLVGYNTDVDSVRWALDDGRMQRGETVLVLGAGGMARAAVEAARAIQGVSVVVSCRSPEANPIDGVSMVPWDNRGKVGANVIVNATPIGMEPDADAVPMPVEMLGGARLVVDAGAAPPISRFCQLARGAGIAAMPGYMLVLRQALAQFRLYTGHEPPEAAMAAALRGAMGLAA